MIRDEPTTTHNPPRTHDWRVYLRSTDVSVDLNCLIKSCVFNLHREFPNPKRG
jgi:transcription initiation factor IIF auxiliary subunit